MPQTEEQKKAALAGAGLTSTQQANVVAGVASKPIDISAITSTPSLNIPAYVPPMPPIIQPPAAPKITNTATQDTLEAERADLTGTISADVAKLGTKSARQREIEASQGVPQLSTDIQELYDQVAQIDAASMNMQNKSEDRFAPTFAITGEQAKIERQAAVKKAGVAAIISAKQGKLALAQDYVTKALAAEFDPISAEIDAKKFLLEQNKDSFSVEEKRRADALSIQLDEQKQQLQDAKEAKKQILDIMLTASQYGADNQTLQKIQNAATPEEATTYAGKVLGSKFNSDEKQRQFDNDIKLAQLSLDRAKLAGETSAAVDPAQILAYAQQYASTGKIPTGIPKGTFGAISQVAKELPKPDGAIIDMNTGTKPDMSDVKIDGLAALYDISQKVAQLKVMDTNRNHGLVSGALSKTFGTADSQKYVDLRTEIIDLLSRARTGAALTASEEKFYSDQLPGRVSNILGLGASSQLRIDNFASKIESTLDTKLKANQAVLYGFSKVDIGGQKYTVGQIVTNEQGQSGRINADGTITLIQ